MVPVVGLEPTRMISPTDFESVTSANSITPAKSFRFSAFFRFLEIGGHGGGQKSNFSIFGFQKIPKSGDFRSSERQTEKDFLSPARLPIPSFRRSNDCTTGGGDWQEISCGGGEKRGRGGEAGYGRPEKKRAEGRLCRLTSAGENGIYKLNWDGLLAARRLLWNYYFEERGF